MLWRILISQAYLYVALLKSRSSESKQNERESETDDRFRALKVKQYLESLDWHKQEDNVTYEEVFIQPFSAVENYLKKQV